MFGNLADPGSDVNQVLSDQRTITRRVALGTGPNVFYIV
jgi:molybdopterin-containing oxidoreductase family iron-sulfur binding subunit